MRKFFTIQILVFLSITGFSQVSPPKIDIYTGVSAGIGESKPFWIINNQYAKNSLNPYEGFLGLKILSIDSSDSFISFNYGLEAYDRQNSENELYLHQAYAELKTPYLNFWAGKKEEIIGNQDSSLSLGSTVWSANARPMPMIELASPGYIDVPLTKGYVELNGSLSHGWFEKDRYVENVYFHQKHLHIRFGGDFFINASLGLLHFAQWGGTSPNPAYGNLPSDWDAYKRVFLVQNGDSSVVNINESINKLGNHLGSRTYRVDFKAESYRIGLYYQTIFEDGSGLAHEFFRDGIGGAVLKFKEKDKFINHVLVEYLHTRYQSGPVHNLNDSIKLIGNDNYFNNSIYSSGWSYNGMTLGTPLLTSPVYNSDSELGVLNNRVFALHFGIGGMIEKLAYTSYFTYSYNYGTFNTPIEPSKQQFSWYFATTIPDIWRKIDLNIQLAADIGQMYGNNLGLILMLRRSFKPF